MSEDKDEAISTFYAHVVEEFGKLEASLLYDGKLLVDVLKTQIENKVKWERQKAYCSVIVSELELAVDEQYSLTFIRLSDGIDRKLTPTEVKAYAGSDKQYILAKRKLNDALAVSRVIDSALKTLDDAKWTNKALTDLVIRNVEGFIL